MFSFLKPRDREFFVLFARQAEFVRQGAELFMDLISNYTNVEEKVRRIKDVEHQCDLVTHELMERMNKTFMTPLDREDIHALASRLDDVLDEIEGVAARMVMFKISKPTEAEARLADILVKAATEIHKAASNLQHLSNLNTFIVEINRLENEADQITREMVARLFERETDVKELLKWKEIYGRLESAADRCEDVANVIESIALKNA